MKRIVIFLFLHLLVLSYFFSEDVPYEIDNWLIFQETGKKIYLVNDSLKNIYKIFPTAKRVIVITEKKVENYSEMSLKFYNFQGKLISKSITMKGEFLFFFSEENSRILVGQKASLIEVDTSYLFDMNGKLVNKLKHHYQTKEIQCSPDNQIVWFISNKIRDLKEGETPLYPSMKITAYNYIMIFSFTSGELLKELAVEGESQVEIEVAHKNYLIQLIPADIPG